MILINLLSDSKVTFQATKPIKKSGTMYALIIFVMVTLLVVSASRAFSQTIMTIEKSDILSDYMNRISDDFKVPENIKSRVGFWFDIYSKYSASEHVIHHVSYPWIVFSVFDDRPILSAPGNRWVKYHKAKALVRAERARVQKTLLSLSKRKNLNRLTEEEQRMLDLLKDLPGPRAKVLKTAALNLRVQLGQKDFMLSGVHTSGKYLPAMEKTFTEHGLPLEITRLPLVESSFNEAAVSKVGASGIWQLMPRMGAHFLYMDSVVDERNSPLKATEAAAKLLKQNLRILKEWPLALTAYNHGPGGLIKASKAVGTRDIGTIIQKYSSRSFGFASSNFYCSFLAALHVEKYQAEVFGETLVKQEELQIKSASVRKSLPMKTIAAVSGLAWDDFLKLNLDIRKQAVSKNKKLPTGFRLLLPAENAEKLEAYFDSLPTRVSRQEGRASQPKL
jgi:membrane-bound lytic murein transglycosylase D